MGEPFGSPQEPRSPDGDSSVSWDEQRLQGHHSFSNDESILVPMGRAHQGPSPARGARGKHHHDRMALTGRRRETKSMSPAKQGDRRPLPQDWSPLHKQKRGMVSYSSIAELKRQTSLSLDVQPSSPPGLASHHSPEKRTKAARATERHLADGTLREMLMLREQLETSRRECEQLARRLATAEARCDQYESSFRRSSSASQASIAGEPASIGTALGLTLERWRHHVLAGFNRGQQSQGALEDSGILPDNRDQEREVSGSDAARREPSELQPNELEELAVRYSWLSRYWTLAHKYGIYPAVARERAEHWSQQAKAVTSKPAAYVHSVAKRFTSPSALFHREAAQASDGISFPSQAPRDPPGSRPRPNGTAAQMAEAERAMRELVELRVPDYVIVAMQDHSQTVKLSNVSKSAGAPWTAEVVELGRDVCEEVRFRRDWIAYIWGRAAASNVEGELATEQAEYWGEKLEEPPQHKDIIDLEHAAEQLRLHSIELRLWRARLEGS